MGTKKVYEFNRIIKDLKAEGRRSMMRRLSRGIWSISSRKYEPHDDLRELFDQD